MTNPPVFQPRPRRPRPAAATLPAVESRTLLLGVLAGLLLPVAVVVAWMLGVHQLGFELAPVLSGVVLFGLAGLAGLWFVLVRRLGWGLPELGLTWRSWSSGACCWAGWLPGWRFRWPWCSPAWSSRCAT